VEEINIGLMVAILTTKKVKKVYGYQICFSKQASFKCQKHGAVQLLIKTLDQGNKSKMYKGDGSQTPMTS
jgi:hypothetical protein